MPPGSAYRASLGGATPPTAGQTAQSGGPGSAYRASTANTNAAPAKKPGGGIFGKIVNAIPGAGAVTHAAGQVAHYTAKTGLGLAADLEQAPGGVYQIGKTSGQAEFARGEYLFGLTSKANVQAKVAAANALGNQIIDQTVQSFQHPLRHPDQTLLNVAAAATLGAGAVVRAADVADAVRAGDVGGAAKAAVSTPAARPRLFTVGDKQIPLQPSLNPAVRLVQKAHDAVVQKAITDRPQGRVASYGTKRLGASLRESRQIQQGIQAAPAAQLEQAGRGLNRTPVIKAKVQQAALRLTSEQATPEERIALHQQQLLKGVGDPKDQLRQIKLLQAVKDQGLVKLDESRPPGEKVFVDPQVAPKLAAADTLLARGAAQRDAIIGRLGEMSPEERQARINHPNVVTATGEPGVATGDQLNLLHPETRPGRNYVPAYTTEPKPSATPIARGQRNVTGKMRNLVPRKSYTGEGLLQGKVPDNTTGLVARQMSRAYRALNTDQFRRGLAQAGSDTRQTTRDVLINTQELKNASVPAGVQAELGNRLLTTEEIAGHRMAFEELRKRFLPHLNEQDPLFGREKTDAVGTPAPAGYKWVDRNLLNDLAAAPQGKAFGGIGGKTAKAFDWVNAGQTAATVYYKIGHVATRYGTNAVTNIIQGSAHPAAIARNFRLWQQLPTNDRYRALGAMREGAFHNLPVEGESRVARIARGGAQFWSRRSDMPFRFNSLAYEARKAGFDTPEKFSKMLDAMEDPGSHGLSAAQAAKVDWVFKRANRESIAYGRLSDAERRYLTRVFWFWPWLKGSAFFAGNTLLEHPFKAASLGAMSAQAQTRQQQELGPLPSYAKALFKVGGTEAQPKVEDISTVSPFATPGKELETVIHGPGHAASSELLGSYFNPATALLARATTNFGARHGQSVGSNVAEGLVSSTPGYTLYRGLKGGGNNPKLMYPTSSQYAKAKFLFGSVVPRVMNRAVANKRGVAELKAR